MVYSLINLPEPQSPAKIEGFVDGQVIRLLRLDAIPDAWPPASRSYEMRTLHHCGLDRVPDDMKQWFARELARVAVEARDVGFEQGRKHIRTALGI